MDAGVFDQWVKRSLLDVESALEIWVPESAPAGLGEAMRYAVLGAGKRLRPLLVMAAAEAVNGIARQLASTNRAPLRRQSRAGARR